MFEKGNKTDKIVLAHDLFVKGCPTSGKRITQFKRLAQITGASEVYLRRIAKEEDWRAEAVAYSKENSLSPTWNASSLVEEISKTRSILSIKNTELLEKVKEMPVDDPKFSATFELFSKVNKQWERSTGVDALLEADKVRKVEAGRLLARAEEEERRKKENDLADDASGKVVPV